MKEDSDYALFLVILQPTMALKRYFVQFGFILYICITFGGASSRLYPLTTVLLHCKTRAECYTSMIKSGRTILLY